MGVESADDILLFFDVEDFGEQVTYTPDGGSATTIIGIFDDPQASRNASEMLEVTIPSPRLVCRTADVPNAADGDELTARGVDYIVRVVLTDGTGVTTLILEEV